MEREEERGEKEGEGWLESGGKGGARGEKGEREVMKGEGYLETGGRIDEEKGWKRREKGRRSASKMRGR